MTSNSISFTSKAPPQFVEVAVISVAPMLPSQPSASAPSAQAVQAPLPPAPSPVKIEESKPTRPPVQRKTPKPKSKTNMPSPRLPPAPGNANPSSTPHTVQDAAGIDSPISARPGDATASPPVKVTAADFRLPMLKNPPTEYPPLALKNGYEGTVKLRVFVLASGLPGEIQIQRSSGHSVLDESAAKQLKRWRFVPARQGETAIDSWIIVPITFQLNR